MMKKKRISTIVAVVLLITLLSGIVALPGLANTITYDILNRVSDPDTSARPGFEDQMGFIDVLHVHDGRIWTDKTVRNGSDVDDFNITLSALSQSFPLTSGYAIPTDTVFVVDVSGSMTKDDAGDGRMRIDVLIEGLNGAIEILQDAHPQNRIAVVAYGGGESGSGRARVEHLLPLGRYTAAAGSNAYFSFVPSPPVNTQQHLRVNVGPNPRAIRVNASTPTQWGIYEGAMILQNEPSKTAWVPKTEGDTVTSIEVTRRPNIVLMTDGEPTMGWSNYLFESAPANPVTPGPTGAIILSPIPPSTAPGVFYGDGSWGELGVSLLTVLTAAHRKRLVEHSYFGTSGTTPGESGQPSPSVGFFSIAFGHQPSDAAQDLIEATMNPGPDAVSADKIDWDIRERMDDLIDPNHPNRPSSLGGNDIFKFNPNNPITPSPLPNGYDGNMGELLREFADDNPIAFHVSRRQSFGLPTSYMWDSTPLTITNDADLTIDEIDFADLFATPTNLEELNDVFRAITTNIQMEGIKDIVTAAGPDRSFDGYLSFSDVVGEYMQVRSVGGLTYNNVSFSRAGFASAIAGNTTQRNEYLVILRNHLNYGADPADHLSAATVANLVASNIANADFLTNNSLKYYANTNRDFVGSFFLPNGTPAPQPATAAAVVEVFPMWGSIIDTPATPAPPSGQTDLRLITFHVITALRTAGFAELYATNAAGDPMVRMLNAGDQMVRWYIPSDLIPIRTPEFLSTGVLDEVTGNIHPIRVNYTVGLDRERVRAGIPQEIFQAYQVPGTTDQMYFYSNRHNPTSTNVTLAFFRPHAENPYYRGSGADERGVIKSQNVTQTAPHVNRNRIVAYSAGSGYDMHWLGNNGRLTLRLIPPPDPPRLGDLTLAKTFTGLPTDMDVFDTSIVSQISFLVVGTNAAGAEIYRNTVIFNSTNFRWNDALSRYEFTLRDLPLGNYLVYERGGNVLEYIVNRPGPPQSVSITSTGQQVSVSFNNNYTPNPVPPVDYPAITIWKTFHGLANTEIPSGFQLRITGPGGFSQTISAAQATAGVTYRNLTPGQYTITETGSNRPGFSMTVNINNQSVSLPYTFTIGSNTTHIALAINNIYTPTPPSPQTGLGDYTLPIIIFMLGAAIIGVAEIYRRKSNKKAKKEEIE